MYPVSGEEEGVDTNGKLRGFVDHHIIYGWMHCRWPTLPEKRPHHLHTWTTSSSHVDRFMVGILHLWPTWRQKVEFEARKG